LIVRHVGTVVARGIAAGSVVAVGLVGLVRSAIPNLPPAAVPTFALPAFLVLVASAAAVWSGARRLGDATLADRLGQR
jgi:hypothetical protein